MTRQLTASSTLDNLKKEAKRWLKALRTNDEQARARLQRIYPNAPAEPGLRDIQHALALEHGLAGWTALKHQLTRNRHFDEPEIDRVAWFIENACPDHHVRGGPAHVRALHTAMRVLKRFPEVAHDSFYTSIVCGDLEEVERVLAARPEAANEKGGPKGWEPLLYLCFTRLPLAASNDNALAIARALLDHGADPNVYFMAGDSRYTPLVGAIGEGEEDRPPHPHRDALARLLLEGGGEPYDIQVIYNIHFQGKVLWFLKLMYEYAVKLGRQSDWDDPTWAMLDMGGYGNGARWHLGIAIGNNDLELAEWVLAHGASPDPASPRHPSMFTTRTLHEEALRMWHTEMAQLLVRYGATPSAFAPDDADLFGEACFRLDQENARALVAKHPEYLTSTEVMFAAANRDRADVVALLLDLGMSPDVEDRQKQRPLHMAAYADSLRVAQLLIERGAEIDPVESNWSNTPLGGAVYGQHALMIELLGRASRDVWELTYVGNVERLREVLSAEPKLAKIVTGGHTPLMWLPPDDEARAMEIARMLLAHGADPSLRNTEGQTAADRAYRLGMFDVAALLRIGVSASPATPAPAGPSLKQFESLAEDVVNAYNSRDTDALRRLQAYLGQVFSLDEFRARLRRQMGISADSEHSDDLSLAKAQFFVARGHGFESWADLAEHALPDDRDIVL